MGCRYFRKWSGGLHYNIKLSKPNMKEDGTRDIFESRSQTIVRRLTNSGPSMLAV